MLGALVAMLPILTPWSYWLSKSRSNGLFAKSTSPDRRDRSAPRPVMMSGMLRLASKSEFSVTDGSTLMRFAGAPNPRDIFSAGTPQTNRALAEMVSVCQG